MANEDKAFGHVTRGINTLINKVQRGVEEEKRGHVNTTVVFMNKYLETAQMHHEFANSSYDENNHASATTHLGHVVDALGAAHQVAHYNLGANSPVTKPFADHMSKIQSHLDDYRQMAGTHDSELGERFSKLMSHNNLNPQQFS